MPSTVQQLRKLPPTTTATMLNLLAILLALPLLSLAARPSNAILLSSVQTLTLRGNGALTSHRRVPAVPQLRCLSSRDICGLYDIDVMRCTNQGSSYGDEDVEWSCSASLPRELKLGSTDVVCEGYASSDDPYVLKGSCAVEYRLVLTDAGEERYPDLAKGHGLFRTDRGGTDWSAYVFMVIFVVIAAWIVYSACTAPNRPAGQPRRRGGNGGGGGGGGWGPGWGPDNDPPPPYPGTKPSSTQQGWSPGFWSGAAGGAAAGYMAGRRGGNQDQPSRSSYGGGSSSGASSSARHETTGFGSTSRR